MNNLLNDFLSIHAAVDKSLLEDDRLFRLLIETMGDGFGMVDSDSILIFVNPRYAEILGYKPDEILGRPVTDFLDDPARSIYEEQRSLRMSGRSGPYELTFKHKGGDLVHTVVSPRPVFNAKGTYLGSFAVITDISRLKKAEAAQKTARTALNESEKLYQALIDNALDAIFITDADSGLIIDANRMAQEFLGRKLEEIRGMPQYQVVIPEQAEIIKRRVSIILEKKRLGPQEYLMPSADGRTTPVEAKSFLVEINGRRHIVGIFREITERKASEENLRAAKEFSERLIETANSIALMLDTEARIVTFNAYAEALTGYKKEEVLGRNWFEMFIPERERETIPKVFKNVLQQMPEYSDYVNPIRKKNGEECIISWRNTVLKNNNSDITGVLSIGADVTESRLVEENLRWELEVNSALARVAGVLIEGDASLDDVTEEVLRSARRMTGSAHGFVSSIDPITRASIAHTMTRMMDDHCAVAEEKKMVEFPIGPDGCYSGLWGFVLNKKPAFFTNDPASHEASSGLPKGHVPLKNFMAAPALFGGEALGQIALANSDADYTGRRLDALMRLADLFALALHRIRAEDQVKTALKEKEVLLREIHHRVKNNMQIISSLLRLQSRLIQDPHVTDMFQTSQNRIRSMAIIHEKLYRSENLTRIDFADYLRGLIAHLISVYRPKGTGLEIDIEADRVHLDINTAIPCGLIVNELVTNSIKHGFPEGKAGTIKIRMFPEQNGHFLSVRDDGIGIAEDFSTEDTQTLGMQIVMDLVAQLKGSFTIQRDRGTVVEIVC